MQLLLARPGARPPGGLRLACLAMATLLGVCVLLQYNDPDPAPWMAIYGAGAVTSALLAARAPLGGGAAWAALALGAATLVWALLLAREVWGVIALSDLTSKMSEKGGAVEVGREAGGLLIQGVWLVVAGVYRRRRA